MMLETMLQAALRTLLVIAAIQLGLRLFRIKRAQLLLIAWTVVLAASLAMPVLQWATPFRLTNILDLPVATLDVPKAFVGEAVDDWQPSVPREVGTALVPNLDKQLTLRPWLEGFYFIVSGLMLLRLLVGFTLALRLVGKAAPIRLKSADGARVRISSNVSAPVTISRIILLPVDFLDWPLATRQAVLAHERSHVARWDFALLFVAQLNRAIFWFSPLSWWLYRHLATLAELTSDDDAIKVAGDRASYAEVLLEMGRRSGPLLRGLAMARPATLKYRIERTLSEGARLDPVSSGQGMIVVIGVAVLSIVAASPEYNSRSPLKLATFSEQQTVAASLSTPSLPPPQSEQTMFEQRSPPNPVVSNAPPQFVHSLPSTVPMTRLQSPPAIQTEAREMLPGAFRNRPSPSPLRTTQQPSRVTDNQYTSGAPRQTKASVVGDSVSPTSVKQDHTNSSGPTGGEIVHALPHQWMERSPESESTLIKLIDQHTCIGSFLSAPMPAFQNPVGSLAVIQTKFFRKADGTPWLTFSSGGSFPVIVPVNIIGNKVEFIGFQNTLITMTFSGANHLIGTAQRPYGNVDLTCGRS